MAGPSLIDPAPFASAPVVFGPEKIREINPQRFEFLMLSGILEYSPEENRCVGFKDVGEDEFWVRGHLPGRPLFPGVLIIEAAAQLCTFFWTMRVPCSPGTFYGFGGVDRVRFRGEVVPPCRLLLATELESGRGKVWIWNTQGFVEDRRVFEGRIIGVEI
jgi:3-hydroxyacyl-[acyl-carrier-protein] dehydratase